MTKRNEKVAFRHNNKGIMTKRNKKVAFHNLSLLLAFFSFSVFQSLSLDVVPFSR